MAEHGPLKRGDQVYARRGRGYVGLLGRIVTVNRCSGSYVKQGGKPATGERCQRPLDHDEYGVSFSSTGGEAIAAWFQAGELKPCP